MPDQKHPNQGRIVQQIPRPSAEALAALSRCYSAFVLDYLGKYGAMEYSIKPLNPGMKFCGPAITCLGPDLTIRKMAIDLAEPGDVLVIAAEAETRYSCFGEYTARKMMSKGMSGIVIDGATRDAAQIRDLGFPTFVRSVSPRNYYYPVGAEYGAINVEVCCGGVLVRPGDVVIGDDDGVVVVPRLTAELLAPVIVSALRDEEEKRSKTVNKPYNVEDELKKRGYSFE